MVHSYEDLGRALLDARWGYCEHSSRDAKIKALTCEQAQLCLLADIARSLRILRCSDFAEIPNVLRRIERNTRKKKRTKGRKR